MSEIPGLDQAVWLESMPKEFNPLQSIRDKSRTVTWIGEELLAPAIFIKQKFEKGKGTMPEIRKFQKAVIRYARHTLEMVGVDALITNDRIIIGQRADLMRIIYTEDEIREQGFLSEQNSTATPQQGTTARARASEAWRWDGDPSERGELPEGGREEVSGNHTDRSEDDHSQ